MKFKVGDIIKGRKDNGYGYTEERMTKAKVLSVYGDRMEIKILEHKDAFYIGRMIEVDNTHTKFELVSGKKVTKKELFTMPVGTKITTDAEKDNEYFYTGKVFEGKDYRLKEYEINEDLTLNAEDEDNGTRIIKIEVPEYSIIYKYSTEIQEMTIAEIEKELGHPVKIIKEED